MARFKEFAQAADGCSVEQSCGDVRVVSCNPALLRLVQARSVLLLQGPLGPFFDRLATWLQQSGIRVHRVAFQAGDAFDSRVLEPIPYRGTPQAWPSALEKLLASLEVDCIVLFGQARLYHAAAIQVAKEKGVTVVVLEEGYFRPGYVTMELEGVNGYSMTLQRYDWSAQAPGPSCELLPPPTTDRQFPQMAYFATRHYLAMFVGARAYPHYRHHKETSVIHYGWYWLKSWLRKARRYPTDTRRVHQLAGMPYYFVPLQHDGDSQITHHSAYGENTDFIIEVLRSFVDHAPEKTLLVFRQHPFSRGGPGHWALIRSLAAELGIADRVVYLVEGHTPTLVRNSLGVVLINSTVGLQALSYGKPLKALGDALYDQPGVPFQGSLDEFWCHFSPPEAISCKRLLERIRHLTQVPCNVYGLRNEPLRWRYLPERFSLPSRQ